MLCGQVLLVEFNTTTGLRYLIRYLEYYLTRADLDYDQGDAMGAAAYLDQRNGTDELARLMPIWETYVQAKSWKPDLNACLDRVRGEIASLHECRVRLEAQRLRSGRLRGELGSLTMISLWQIGYSSVEDRSACERAANLFTLRGQWRRSVLPMSYSPLARSADYRNIFGSY